MRKDNLHKFAIVFRILQRSIEKRFGITAYRCERRSQFVRDVGYKIFADLLLTVKIRYIVQHNYSAPPLYIADGQSTRFKPASRRARQLKAVSFRRSRI